MRCSRLDRKSLHMRTDQEIYVAAFTRSFISSLATAAKANLLKSRNKTLNYGAPDSTQRNRDKTGTRDCKRFVLEAVYSRSQYLSGDHEAKNDCLSFFYLIFNELAKTVERNVVRKFRSTFQPHHTYRLSNRFFSFLVYSSMWFRFICYYTHSTADDILN